MNDILAIIIIGLGLFVTYLEMSMWFAAKIYRWVYLFKASAGAGISFMFLIALLSEDGLVPPSLGRPIIILVLGALSIGAIIDKKRGGI